MFFASRREMVRKPYSSNKKVGVDKMLPCTIFLRSDAVATIYFAARFVRLLFEGGYYLRATFISLESSETSTMAR